MPSVHSSCLLTGGEQSVATLDQNALFFFSTPRTSCPAVQLTAFFPLCSMLRTERRSCISWVLCTVLMWNLVFCVLGTSGDLLTQLQTLNKPSNVPRSALTFISPVCGDLERCPAPTWVCCRLFKNVIWQNHFYTKGGVQSQGRVVGPFWSSLLPLFMLFMDPALRQNSAAMLG